MECNKEEALRAKTIAHRKMEDNDFGGGLKFAMKAQQLYPETENISQMICVCEVHCSAENKIIANESDWYGILQIEQTADDILIKKQYRKLAFALHPDKNKFSGAESAFKLIGQAQRVLLDKEKRSLYDLKCKTVLRPVMPNETSQQASKAFNGTNISRVQKNSMGNSNSNSNAKGSNPPMQAQSVAPNGKETFWTQCPFCSVRYQYYKDVLTKALRCQSCSRPFIAHDMRGVATQPGVDATQPVFPQKDTSNTKGTNSMSRPEKNKETKQSGKRSNNVQGEKKEGTQPSSKENGKRGRKEEVEFCESFESDSSLKEIHPGGVGGNKQNVSHNENANNDHKTINPSKRSKGSEPSIPLTENKADASGNGQAFNTAKLFGTTSASTSTSVNGGAFKSSFTCETGSESIKKSSIDENGCASPETTREPIYHEYSDPEFCDFEKDREEHCFKVGQVWAAYATVDAMPRFYARIKKVFISGFKLRITWLEPDPDDEDGKKWAESELPFSCGKFKFGDSIDTTDRLMFSHEVSWDKGIGRDSTKVYPRKGQTWALFKNYDANWYEIPQSKWMFEYEYVEVLSEYDANFGIRVALLGKLKGFANLFCQVDGNEVQIIPPLEILRFSHRIPSHRMTGVERKDVPKGSFELDPASIPTRLEENNCVKDLSSNSSLKTANVDVNDVELPDTEFCNFDILKSPNKFKVNQVWALYSDIDGFPNYYGLIKKVELHPSLKLQIAWLEACNLSSNMFLWKDKDLPVSCGQFMVKASNVQQYTSNSSFSHEIRAPQTMRKNIFTIYPQIGEIWGTYKNWDPEMTSLSLVDCEYTIVEVLEENSSCIKVSVLERVPGFSCVFKPKMNGDSRFTREIPRMELLTFSHQIPSFKLTSERDGSLSGYWEVDPAALPTHVLAEKAGNREN